VALRGEALLCARAGYYGLLNHLDDQIRRIFNPVTGVERMTGNNTATMLVSDHGEMLGDHYLWRKTVPYEPSVRIPFLLRAPEHFGIAPRTVVDKLVCLADVMPTLLDLAGVEIPDSVEGCSVLPLARGEETAWRKSLHIEHSPVHHALTDGREKYVWFATDGREQLFDLVEDPRELRDFSKDRPDRLLHWRERMIRELEGRPEGFSDGERLVPGRPYAAVLPHALRSDRE
jgi:arylsulfatase A-like enzyme